MFRKWSFRLMIVVGAALGVFLLLAVTLQVPAVGKTIGSPQACGTCHVMKQEVVTLEHSSHRDLACLDCHAAQGFIDKPIDELKSSGRHIYYFLTDNTPDIIKPQEHSRKVVQANCEKCHAATVDTVHAPYNESGRFCFDCHREVPHSRPLRN